MAGGSAVLTFVILAGFAGMVAVLTDRQVTSTFDTTVATSLTRVEGLLNGRLIVRDGVVHCAPIPTRARDLLDDSHGQIRVFSATGAPLCAAGPRADVGAPPSPQFTLRRTTKPYGQYGYRVLVRQIAVAPGTHVYLLYAQPSDTEHTENRVQFVLLLGVLGGSVLALLAGLATAQRAIRPVVRLTEAAREIERTRDASHHIPHPEAHDEVAELARTLEDMLSALDDARRQSEILLERQREFVADASHELRTPLTSVLANLELLAEELDGEQAESAQSALRATQRMRRLVGDLLLLARADARRVRQHRPTDLGEVVAEAAAELGPLADDHDLSVTVTPTLVPGVRDDLHRMVLNLLQNAVQHTPPGTHIGATLTGDGSTATLVVQDDGPGIDPELERRVFERFVRGGGDGGRGSGLGLAIVQAVAASHGGSVTLSRPARARGTRFVVQLPQHTAADRAPEAQTSTTTGSTIGRRRSRS